MMITYKIELHNLIMFRSVNNYPNEERCNDFK